MQTFCGYIGIVGRPNVGKSSILNHIVGMKVSITSSKPQTTREQIVGIDTFENYQAIFIDSPGWQSTPQEYTNRLMNRAAEATFTDADILLWVVDSSHFNDIDEAMLVKLKNNSLPLVIALNKSDKSEDENLLLLAQKLVETLPKAQVVPCSAKTNYHIDKLMQVLRALLPEQPFIFPEDMVTDRNEKFYAREIIREKIMRNTGEEIPYAVTVEIDRYLDEPKLISIDATIWVDKENQKGIIVGKGGECLKKIGQDARLDIQKFWDKKVCLKTWVKVKKPGFIPST